MTIALIAIAANFAAQGAVPVAPPASSPTLGVSNYVDLEGGIGYSSNPYLTFGSGAGRALMRASVHAVHTRYSTRSTTSLSAYGENVSYLGRYGSQQIFQLIAHHDAAVSEKLRVFGDLTGSLDRSGQLGTRFLSVGPDFGSAATTTTILLLPSLPDAQGGFVASSGRTYQVGAQVGAQLALSAVDSLTARAAADHVLLRGTSFDSSYNVYLASLGYDRRLSARATVGEIVTVRSTNYKGRERVTVVTPQATAHLALSDTTDLSGAIGVSFASVKNGVVTRHSTGLAASGSLCHRGETDQLCVTVARDQQTATIAGPATGLNAGLTYSKRIDAKQTLQLSASGSRYSQPFSDLNFNSVAERSSYLSGGAQYTRQLGSRLYSGANLSVRKLFRDGPEPKADFGVSMFLRFRLGDRQ